MRAFYIMLVLGLLILAAGSSCSGTGARQPEASTLPAQSMQRGIPEPCSLPHGLGLRQVSSENMELLDSLPVAQSPGASSSAGIGSLTLTPAQNGGMAWAIYELFDFPGDGSV